MSWISEVWRKIKGGKTDTQTVFGLIVSTLSARQRVSLRQNLYAVQQAIEIAALAEPNSTQVLTAREWVDGALEVLL